MGNANTDTKDLTHSQRHATQSQILDAAQTRGEVKSSLGEGHGNITMGHLKKNEIRTSALSNSSMEMSWKRKRGEKKKAMLEQEIQASYVLEASSLYFSSLERNRLERCGHSGHHRTLTSRAGCCHTSYTCQVSNLAGPDSLVAQWLSLHVPNTRGVGSNPGWGSRIPHATQCGQEKNKQKTS